MGPPLRLESEGARARSNHDSVNLRPLVNVIHSSVLDLPRYVMILMTISFLEFRLFVILKDSISS